MVGPSVPHIAVNRSYGINQVCGKGARAHDFRKMSLLAFGVNHRSAPMALRERVNIPDDALPGALRALNACQDVREAAILSTCNRTDLYCGLSEGAGESVIDWFREYHKLSAREWNPYQYVRHSDHAVRHIMRVASGLDSMILGEPQILGQIKDAYLPNRHSNRYGRTHSGAAIPTIFCRRQTSSYRYRDWIEPRIGRVCRRASSSADFR